MPLLLAEKQKLGQGHRACNRIYHTNIPMVKNREIYQLYNNHTYITLPMYIVHVRN